MEENKGKEQPNSGRNRAIVRTSFIGIVANVALAAFKAAVGALAGSIAIIMDAVNNLSDAMSSVITILGTKLSERPADRMHPFGYGRVEYFSAIVIAVIVLAAGVTSGIESVKKIFAPTSPNYSTLTLVVVGVAVVAKLVLGGYVKAHGKKLQSDALIASGADALFDSLITLSTLVSAGVMLLWHISLDGILGTIISLLVIKSGIEMLRSPIDQLLGGRVSAELVRQIKQDVLAQPVVRGVYDLILHTYGPDTMIGSMHVSVANSTTAVEVHRLERSIIEMLFSKYGIVSTIGIYADNVGDSDAARLQHEVTSLALAQDWVHSAHAFFVDEARKFITLDVLIDYGVKDVGAKIEELATLLGKVHPGYTFNLTPDYNFTEE